ncbi:hypothetical protein RHEph01_gp004 [Rhizobium phage RHEph01]|uniref:Uncharacterized protein n=1 Tax=Rhizobium phage RHEph01 TaxID=1220601 RepID=L7TK90_9CAUD|nr:hypothetical protein HOQ88_gp04 [Rhizobium phage RHEph01]AGC35515.1 hypothetical protein RHEph01_gp004 [Rhizobium phage RHEph01]
MKTVVSNDMVAHLWANQSQAHAKSGNGNLFFDGVTIYSYGHHFPIAKFITNEAGETAILFTTDRYSVTTSGHVSRVWRSINYGRGYTVFEIEKVGDSLDTNKERAFRKIAELLDKAKRARSRKDSLIAEAHSVAINLNRWAAFIGEPAPFPNADDLDETIRQALENERKRAEEARKRRAEEQAKRAAEVELLAAEWVAGGDIDGWRIRDSRYIRVRAKGDLMETSWGAHCPLKDAIAIFKIAAECRAGGYGFVPPRRIEAGSFALRHILDNGTIQVGCHTIEWQEAERLALELGVIEAPIAAKNVFVPRGWDMVEGGATAS